MGESRTLCFIDLNRFKTINDSCGHAAGDELLLTLANTIENIVGEGGVVARMGGDEFAILFKQQHRSECVEQSQKILHAVKNIRFEWNDQVFRVSASIGLACIENMAGDASSWLNRADTACLEAKKLGRDNIQFFDFGLDFIDKRKQEGKIYNEIVTALETDQFILYAQDIIPLKDNCTLGLSKDEVENDHSNGNIIDINSGDKRAYYEVLVRMLDSEGKVVSPADFLPAVETLSLSVQLDKWVVDHTLAWLKENPAHLNRLARCSINLSGYSVTNSTMRDFIVTAILASGVPADKICFEIIETAAIQDIAEAQKLIQEVGALGCLFALDDFGSGFASFSYLQQLDIDIIKIDGQFIKDLDSNPMHKVMVKSLSDIANVGGMKTVGEFVETENIAKCLMLYGIDYAQGYHFSVPVPLAEKADQSIKLKLA